MTDFDLADRLRRAVAGADPSWTVQPSRLRRALADELGADGHRCRSQVHQLVVAADEHIPVRLRRTGWSPEVRDELATALMAARGWTEAAAVWAVTTWAAALDLIEPTAGRATATVEPAATDTATDVELTDNGSTDVATTGDDRATNIATDIADTTGSTPGSVGGDAP